MPAFVRSLVPLIQDEIFKTLSEIRRHSWSPSTNFQVATLVEVKKDNFFYYIAGVNIENEEHHRLSMHSEQDALANAMTLLGGDTKFSQMWIMAAPGNATPDQELKVGKACGHCRQIMINFAEPNAKIFMVGLDGTLGEPDSFENNFLPDAFSEKSLNLAPMNKSGFPQFFNTTKLKPWDILNESSLDIIQTRSYLQVLTPHIITHNLQTSPITACIIKCNNGRYVAGVLKQDIAFLTTDAIYAAIGMAITQFGNNDKDLRFDEIHCFSTATHATQLSFSEIETLSHHYAHNETRVHFYTIDNQFAEYSFLECINGRSNILAAHLKENTAYKFQGVTNT